MTRRALRTLPGRGPAVPHPRRGERTNEQSQDAADGESDTTKPRLIAQGANLKRVCIYGPEHGDVTDPDGSKRAFSLDRDLPVLRQTIIDTQAKVVIISPVMTFMGQKDAMRDQEVRQVLTPLVAMAAKLKCVGRTAKPCSGFKTGVSA